MRHGGMIGGVMTVLLAGLLSGCGPQVPREDMGEILEGLPVVPGVETPYPLPELEPVASGETAPEASVEAAADSEMSPETPVAEPATDAAAEPTEEPAADPAAE